MYSSKPALVFGFHGIDREAAIRILNQQDDFHHSQNDYDWLGHGIYFWENNLSRAKQYAKMDSNRAGSKTTEPFVLGAVLELGNCLDLLSQDGIEFVKEAYVEFKEAYAELNIGPLPANKSFNSNDFDFKKRELDCAVIRFACELAKDVGKPFDSVRAAFVEGGELYPGAKFHSHNHI
jgi:hypothetical protein